MAAAAMKFTLEGMEEARLTFFLNMRKFTLISRSEASGEFNVRKTWKTQPHFDDKENGKYSSYKYLYISLYVWIQDVDVF